MSLNMFATTQSASDADRDIFPLGSCESTRQKSHGRTKMVKMAENVGLINLYSRLKSVFFKNLHYQFFILTNYLLLPTRSMYKFLPNMYK